MKERTEEEKVSQAGIVVKLGGGEYSIPPLVIRDARKWRQKVLEVLLHLPNMETTSDEPEAFDKAMKLLLVTMQDTVIDLFFEYAKDLDRDEIEGKAFEEDVADAFERIVEVAFPLAQSLSKVNQRLSR